MSVGEDSIVASRWLPILVTAATCIGARALYAGSPRDDVLRLVPDSAGICILVQDVRSHGEQLRKSPFVERLAATALGQSFRDAPETKQLAEIDRQLRHHLNTSWDELRDDVLGDAFVLAYTPGTPEKPDDEQALFVLHARRPDRLKAILDRLNTSQQDSRELLAMETREFAGREYVFRKTAKGHDYYALIGSLVVFSNSEAQLRWALETDHKLAAADFQPPKSLTQLQQLGIDRDLLVIWLNPRLFDAAMRQHASVAQGAEADVLRHFADCWSALEVAAMSLRLDRDVALTFSMRARAGALPPALERVFSDMQKPAAIWSSFPADALFAAAGRVSRDSTKIDERPAFAARKTIQDAFQHGVGATLSRDLLSEVSRFVGPDWGICVWPPDSHAQSWAPSAIAAVRLQSEAAPAMEQRVLNGLNILARLIIAGVNAQTGARWHVRSVKQGDLEVRFIDCEPMSADAAKGIRPAFACKGGYLVIASSPEAIARFQPPASADTQASDNEVPIMRLAFRGWATYLRSYREPLARFASKNHNLPIDDVRSRFDRLAETLELFDTMVLSQRVSGGVASVTLRLKPAAPLK
jgi:hypothetical protein